MHCVAEDLYVPSSQTVQAVAPDAALTFPVGQSKQEDAPVLGWYVPALQAVLMDHEHREPAGHVLQPVQVRYLPLLQTMASAPVGRMMTRMLRSRTAMAVQR